MIKDNVEYWDMENIDRIITRQGRRIIFHCVNWSMVWTAYIVKAYRTKGKVTGYDLYIY